MALTYFNEHTKYRVLARQVGSSPFSAHSGKAEDLIKEYFKSFAEGKVPKLFV